MDVQGAPIFPKNQGETILSQGCNPSGQTLGIVTDASLTSLTDSEILWGTFNPRLLGSSRVIAIVKGKGTGQWRYITDSKENTLYIDRPWDVVPEAGSNYVVTTWSAEDWLVNDNILEGNHQGIMFYCGCNDVSVEGNKLTNSSGIYIRSDQRKEAGRYNLTWNASVENNEIIRTEGTRAVSIYSILAVQPKQTLTGTGIPGSEIRRNLVQAKFPNVTSSVPGEGYWNEVKSSTPDALDKTVGILGTVFEKNTAINCDYGYRLSKAISQTIIRDPVFVDVPEKTNDLTFPESSETGTVIITKEDTHESENDPIAPYLTGKAPKTIKDMGEEVEEGLRVHKLIFHSYDYSNDSEQYQAQIFAAIVRPDKKGKYPGLLVLHGGGGYAEIDKAKKWAAQGYIVVVLDEPGVANPDKIPFSHGPWDKYKYGENRFVVKPEITSSTLFSAVLASVQGLYLLYDQPDVIKDKIGIVGISWGGYLTAFVSGLANQMIKASFSVYGSGFYDDGTTFLKMLNKMKPEERAVWLKYLDAGRRAVSVKTPFFIASGTNDNWFYPPAVTSTLKNIKGQTNHVFSQNCSHKIDLPGGTVDRTPEQPGWLSMEQIYFDYYLKGIRQPFPKILEIKAEKSESGNTLVRFKLNSQTKIENGQVCYSPVGVEWPKRIWKTVSASLSDDNWYEAEIPSKDINQSFECFATVSDSRPVSVSSYMIWCK